MKNRVIAVVLATLGVLLVHGTDADAHGSSTPELIIGSSDDIVMSGQRVLITGLARHVSRRTVVRLQHRVAGEWDTVARRRVSSSLGVRFHVTPPRGVQRYRLATVPLSRQPAVRSSSITIASQWTPTVSLTAAPLFKDGAQWFDLSGTVGDPPPGAAVEIQVLGGSGWATQQTVTPVDGQFAAEIARQNGGDYRAVLKPAAETTEAVSNVVHDTLMPYVLPVGHHSSVWIGANGTPKSRTLLTDLPAGERVTIAAEVGDAQYPFCARVSAPDGTVVGRFGNCGSTYQGLIRFVPPAAATYTIQVDTDSSAFIDLSVSTPVQQDLTLDGSRIDFTTHLSGQEVVSTFTAEAGEAFTIHESKAGPSGTLLGPDGSEVEPLVPGDTDSTSGIVNGYGAVFIPEQTGTYTYRLSSPVSGFVQVLRVSQDTAEVDGDPISLHDTRGGAVSLVWADTDQDDVVSVTVPSQHYVSDTYVESADGSGLKPSNLGDPGRHLVVVRRVPYAGAEDDPVVVRVGSPVDLDTVVDGDPVTQDLSQWSARVVRLHFTGTAGEAVNPVSDQLGGYRWTLTDTSGVSVPGLFDAFVLPHDGTYVATALIYPRYGWDASLYSTPIADIPANGDPGTLVLAHSNGVGLGRLVAPAGTLVEPQILGGDIQSPWPYSTPHWTVAFGNSRGEFYDQWWSTQPSYVPTFTMPEDGVAYFVLTAGGDATGTVDVAADVKPAP